MQRWKESGNKNGKTMEGWNVRKTVNANKRDINDFEKKWRSETVLREKRYEDNKMKGV